AATPSTGAPAGAAANNGSAPGSSHVPRSAPASSSAPSASAPSASVPSASVPSASVPSASVPSAGNGQSGLKSAPSAVDWSGDPAVGGPQLQSLMDRVTSGYGSVFESHSVGAVPQVDSFRADLDGARDALA